jgi:hypothetical protein
MIQILEIAAASYPPNDRSFRRPSAQGFETMNIHWRGNNNGVRVPIAKPLSEKIVAANHQIGQSCQPRSHFPAPVYKYGIVYV